MEGREWEIRTVCSSAGGSLQQACGTTCMADVHFYSILIVGVSTCVPFVKGERKGLLLDGE